jgi:rhodanese-related sulfurtransferase
MTNTVAELVASARSGISNLSVDEVARELDSGAVTLVDVREPGEVERDGTIPGAVTAPRGMLEFYADPSSPYHRAEFDPAVRTIVYCASGGRSALSVRALQALGYGDVAHLDGGMKAWTAQGRPVTRQTA